MRVFALLFSLIIVSAGCGSGSPTDPSLLIATSLSGTVAVGAPVANARITLTDAKGTILDVGVSRIVGKRVLG